MSQERTDAELILASRHDPAAFRELYDRCSETLLTYFYRRTLDAEDAADLVAETFAVAYKKRLSYKEDGKPGMSWLYGIGRRELSHYRRRQRCDLKMVETLGMTMPELDTESIERIEHLVDASEYSKKLLAALGQLKAKDREAIYLRVQEDKDFKGVAEALGCTEGAARVRVHRGLSRLADIFGGGP